MASIAKLQLASSFTPGWDLVGVVEKLGEGVTSMDIGQCVTAMPIHGAYAEYICLPLTELVRVPQELDKAEAVSLVLNYVRNCLPDAAPFGQGQRGTEGPHPWSVRWRWNRASPTWSPRWPRNVRDGTCSARRADAVRDLGGIPIDHQTQDFVQEIQNRRLTGVGVDAMCLTQSVERIYGPVERRFVEEAQVWDMTSFRPCEEKV